jgi:hypothetical protein
MPAETASTNSDTSKMASAGEDAGAKMLVGLSGSAVDAATGII